MDRLILLFSLAPVMKGFIAMGISGAVFPLCGVMVLRLNLVPMRYMLMHGVILGGAIAMALNVPLLPVTITVNLILVFMMLMMTNDGTGRNFGGTSAATMVLSMALASLIMHAADVPAKDTLSLMWGSPFALTSTDLVVLAALAVLLVLYIILNFRNIVTIFFNSEIAISLGVKVGLHRNIMVLIIALVVALAMKLLGAFLVDALLILPVLSASVVSGKKFLGMKKLFIISSIIGLVLSAFGFLLAVGINWPPAATISMLSGFAFLIFCIFRKFSTGVGRK